MKMKIEKILCLRFHYVCMMITLIAAVTLSFTPKGYAISHFFAFLCGFHGLRVVYIFLQEAF